MGHEYTPLLLLYKIVRAGYCSLFCSTQLPYLLMVTVDCSVSYVLKPHEIHLGNEVIENICAIRLVSIVEMSV